ncbi:restriction endonuclease [Blastococcus sp. SYSU DS0753]
MTTLQAGAPKELSVKEATAHVAERWPPGRVERQLHRGTRRDRRTSAAQAATLTRSGERECVTEMGPFGSVPPCRQARDMQDGDVSPRRIRMHQVLRYSNDGDAASPTLDGYTNYHWLTSPPGGGMPRLMLDAGINAPAPTDAPDARRRSVIGIRSSPWKAGHDTNPWHDEFDLDHGYVRYFGDHKPSSPGLPGTTPGNKALFEALSFHASPDPAMRRLAPPLLLFRSVTVRRDGRTLVKGHIEFCGVAVIDRLENVVQRDPATQTGFPNIALDLAVLSLADSGETLDLRWIDDRRNPELTADQALEHAPTSWRRWVADGSPSLPRVRRRVQTSRIRSREQQLPEPRTPGADLLQTVYKFFDKRKHAFEMLASQIAAEAIGGQGGTYREGWLSRAGGDGGLDFVGRLDVGSPGTSTPLVVLGQAKCVQHESSVSPDQVARVVARLRRGWVGVYVTTGWFSRQAQMEIVDDEYPIILIPGIDVAKHVLALADRTSNGDVDAVLVRALDSYPEAVTHRRPEEVLFR